MASIEVSSYGEALAANAGADGTLQVADTTKYFAGCFAWLSDSASHNQCVRITLIVDSTHMKAQKVTDDSVSNVQTLSYGYSDLSAFLTANSARIDMPNQTAHIDPAYTQPVTP